jgi:hypothetical protein
MKAVNANLMSILLRVSDSGAWAILLPVFVIVVGSRHESEVLDILAGASTCLRESLRERGLRTSVPVSALDRSSCPGRVRIKFQIKQ